MGRLNVFNGLKRETICVKEGSGSAFLTAKPIPPGEHLRVYVNSHATLREFVVVLETPTGKLQEKFDSDECQQWAEIRITGSNGSRLTYETSVRSSLPGAGIMTFVSNAWQLLFKKLGTAPQDGGNAPTGGLAVAQNSGGSPTGGSAPEDGNAPTGGSAAEDGSAPTGGSAAEDGSAPTGSSVPNKPSDAS